MPKKVEVRKLMHSEREYLEIDGEKYMWGKTRLPKKNQRSGEIVIKLRKFDLKDYEGTIDRLAEKISERTNVKEIIKQALYEIPLEDLEKVKKEMAKSKPKVRNNRGCFFLSIGKTQLGIRR